MIYLLIETQNRPGTNLKRVLKPGSATRIHKILNKIILKFYLDLQ